MSVVVVVVLNSTCVMLVMPVGRAIIVVTAAVDVTWIATMIATAAAITSVTVIIAVSACTGCCCGPVRLSIRIGTGIGIISSWVRVRVGA